MIDKYSFGSLAHNHHDETDASPSDSQNTPRIEPLFNSAFIRIFGREESKGITRSLVNSILTRAGINPIDEITTIDAEHTSVEGGVDCKTPRMDVCIVTANRRIIDLEAQCYPEDIVNRSLLYASQLMSAYTPKRTRFKDIPQVIVITLLDDAPLFPDSPDFVNTCQMAWLSNGRFSEGTDRMAFVLVELEKVRRRYNMLSEEVLSDRLLSWLYLLTEGFDDKEEANAIMDAFPDLEEFATMYGYALNDPKLVRAYEDYASAEREYQSRKDYFERVEREARERGEAEGFADGMKRGHAEGRAQGIKQGIKQGIEQGIKQGIEQGIEQGMAKEQQAVAERLRAAGYDEKAIRVALGQ